MSTRLVRHFSDALNGWAALVGIPPTRITTEIAAVFVVQFNLAIQKMWTLAPWPEVSPYGEARFLGNRLTYPNDLTQSAYWIATAVTPTANVVPNPCDGNTTASLLLETVANSAHKVVQNVTNFFPNTGYTVSFWARPNGRSWQYVSVFDGVTTYTAFFNTTTGTVGTFTNFATSTMAQQANGFYLCQVTFTANAAATNAGTFSLQLSTDGSTISYAGSATAGAYFWGALVQQTSNVPVQDSVLPWNQTGENDIDAIFACWPVNPFSSNWPPQLGYNITPNGVQVINGTPYNYSYYINGIAQSSVYSAPPANPLYIYYRKTCPNYTGDVFDATLTYAVGQQVYFTSSTGYSDFYACVVATTAGQSPDTTAASWAVIPMFDTFLQYCIFQSFGDWLISDGQVDKANAIYANAQGRMDDQLDKSERQMNILPTFKVATHLTSRPRF